MKKINFYLLAAILYGIFLSLYFPESIEFKNDEQLIVKYLSEPESFRETLKLNTPNEGRGVNHSMLPTRFAGMLTYLLFDNDFSPVSLRFLYTAIPISIIFLFSSRILNSKNKLFILFTLALGITNPYSLLIIRKLWTHGGPLTMAGYLIIFFLLFERKTKIDTFLLGCFVWILVTLHTTAILYSLSISFLVFLYFKKNKSEIKHFVSGSLIGIAISSQWIYKVITQLGQSNNLLTSQGESAYWVLMFQYLKLENIKFDIGVEFFSNSLMSDISLIAGLLVGALVILNVALIFSYQFKDIIFFSPFIITGILFIIFDLYLYPRYVVSFWPLIYIPLTVTMLPKYQNIKIRKIIKSLLIFLLALNMVQSSIIFNEISSNPENIEGNIGKVYDICGNKVDDAKACR